MPDQLIISAKKMLFLKARADISADLHTDRTVVRAGFGQGAVAPAMGGVLDIGYVFGKGFVRQGRYVHFLGANVAANVIGFHMTQGVKRKT